MLSITLRNYVTSHVMYHGCNLLHRFYGCFSKQTKRTELFWHNDFSRNDFLMNGLYK